MNSAEILKNNQGAAIVEFALVLPLFLLLILGIIEFGIIMYNKAMITNASREGSRFGVLYVDPPKSKADIEKDVKDRVADKLGTDADNLKNSILISLGDSATINIQVDDVTGDDGDKYLEVKVTYPYSFLVPKLLGFNSLDITAATTMRMENQEDPE